MVYTRSMHKKSTEAKATSQTYSDQLPFDLFLPINQHLSLKDNIRASAVCKTWHKAFVPLRVEDPTPWAMFIPLYKDEYELYDPSLGKTHIVKFPELRGSDVRYSRDGWLLMNNFSGTENFFFNPFTHERIEVAWRDMRFSDVIAFSCAPTSSSCVIFTADISTTLVIIQTYRLTIKNRKTLTLPNRLPLDHGGFQHVVFSNGVFYCLTNAGCLGMFDLSTNSWTVLPQRPPKRLETDQCFMIEYQEDIFLVYTHHDRENTTDLKLDLPNQKWTEKRRLRGLTFYLGFQCAVTTNRDLVCTPRLNRCSEFIVWIKPPLNVSNLFKS